MDDRREFDARLAAMDEKLDSRFKTTDQKLDDHGQDLREIRNALVVIAQQAERINALTAMQTETRGDIAHLEIRVRAGEVFRSACPATNIKSSVRTIWIYVVGVSAAIGAAMISHIFGGKQ